MKKIILLYAIIGLFILGCGEADTIDIADYFDPYAGNEEGEVKLIRVSVCGSEALANSTTPSFPATVNNPFIVIKFTTPAKASTITYDSSIQVLYGTAQSPILIGTTAGCYKATPSTSDLTAMDGVNTIRIDLSLQQPITPDTEVRIILAPTIEAYADTSIKLYNYGTFTRTIIP